VSKILSPKVEKDPTMQIMTMAKTNPTSTENAIPKTPKNSNAEFINIRHL
jgi:hypothetical protein